MKMDVIFTGKLAKKMWALIRYLTEKHLIEKNRFGECNYSAFLRFCAHTVFEAYETDLKEWLKIKKGIVPANEGNNDNDNQ